MKKYKGVLFGWFEPGLEGTVPALQELKHIDEEEGSWSYEGLRVIDPGDHLVIYEKNQEVFNGVIEAYLSKKDDDGKVLIDKPGCIAKWRRCPINPGRGGNLRINGNSVYWLPTNIDLELWWDVFFKNSESYTGILTKNKTGKESLNGC